MNTKALSEIKVLGPVSRKSRKLFGPKKPFAKLRALINLLKLVFSCVVKGIKIKITAKFRALRRLGFEDTKRTIYVTQNAPKKFRDFREMGLWAQMKTLNTKVDNRL